jgi:hypothetical protein
MLGDKIVVTTTTGPGKVEEHIVEAKASGGQVDWRFDNTSGNVVIVQELTRKDRVLQSLVVNVDNLVALRTVYKR